MDLRKGSYGISAERIEKNHGLIRVQAVSKEKLGDKWLEIDRPPLPKNPFKIC
ncbi:MAG: hypothetical protein MUP82_08940 [Candidatus Marinimicrobia bacterium]|nr:hypothetical protein [Candidatus Neomarinimicrobiota bacterium]